MNQRDFSLIRVLKGDKKGNVLPCTRDRNFYIGSDEDQCQLVLQGQGIDPVHACVYFNPENGLFGVRNLSEGDLILEGGGYLPTDRTIHIPEGTILYLGGRDQAIMLGSKNASSYTSFLLPPGTLIREKYMIVNKPLQNSGGMMYNGIRFPYDRQEGKETGPKDPALLTPYTIYCMKRERYIPYRKSPDLPGVLPVTEIIQEYESVFFILDGPPGIPLRHLLEENETWSFPEICAYIRPLVNILGSLHDYGQPMGYVSPDRIFVADDEEGNKEVRLLTVGAIPTKGMIPPDLKQKYLDPHYAAPEYLNSSLINDPEACEIYSICSILYRALTGNTPDRMTDQDPSAFSDLTKDRIREEGISLILSGLARNPDDRISSLKDLAKQIDQACQAF